MQFMLQWGRKHNQSICRKLRFWYFTSFWRWQETYLEFKAFILNTNKCIYCRFIFTILTLTVYSFFCILNTDVKTTKMQVSPSFLLWLLRVYWEPQKQWLKSNKCFEKEYGTLYTHWHKNQTEHIYFIV